MSLPETFSDLYPNDYLHADQLKGKKVTVTIKDIVMESFKSAKGSKKLPSVHLVESPLKLGTNKTNGYCLKRMFGSNPHDWIGKKITIFPTTTRMGGETLACIRVWGSPLLTEDMKITVPQGQNKPIEMTMHKVVMGKPSVAAPDAAPSTSEPIPEDKPAPDFAFDYNPDAEAVTET